MTQLISIDDLLQSDDEEKTNKTTSQTVGNISGMSSIGGGFGERTGGSGGLGTTAAERAEERRQRMERLKQGQIEREAKAREQAARIREISGDRMAKKGDGYDSSSEGSGARKNRHQDRRTSYHRGSHNQITPKKYHHSGPPTPNRGNESPRRRRRSLSSNSSDSFDDWGVVVADRGTQTFSGITIETQTDPHPHVIACKECYKKHFGRDVEIAAAAAGSGCEHGISDIAQPAHPSVNYFADPSITYPRPSRDQVSELLGDYSTGLTSAHWKVQLSRIHGILDKTLTQVTPDIVLANEVLSMSDRKTTQPEPQQQPQPQSGVSHSEASLSQRDDGQVVAHELESLKEKLNTLQEAYDTLLTKKDQPIEKPAESVPLQNPPVMVQQPTHPLPPPPSGQGMYYPQPTGGYSYSYPPYNYGYYPPAAPPQYPTYSAPYSYYAPAPAAPVPVQQQSEASQQQPVSKQSVDVSPASPPSHGTPVSEFAQTCVSLPTSIHPHQD